MLEINPKKLEGNWSEGFALDFHTISATYLGDSPSGHPQFDTTYSEVGKQLRRLKYDLMKGGIPDMAATAADFIQSKDWDPDMIIPVPPSKDRQEQPVLLLAYEIAKILGIPVSKTAIIKVKPTPPLKDVLDFNERVAILKEAFEVSLSEVIEKRVLLFDDLYRSGATLHSICDCLMSGQPERTFVLTMTKTRSNR